MVLPDDEQKCLVYITGRNKDDRRSLPSIEKKASSFIARRQNPLEMASRLPSNRLCPGLMNYFCGVRREFPTCKHPFENSFVLVGNAGSESGRCSGWQHGRLLDVHVLENRFCVWSINFVALGMSFVEPNILFLSFFLPSSFFSKVTRLRTVLDSHCARCSCSFHQV